MDFRFRSALRPIGASILSLAFVLPVEAADIRVRVGERYDPIVWCRTADWLCAVAGSGPAPRKASRNLAPRTAQLARLFFVDDERRARTSVLLSCAIYSGVVALDAPAPPEGQVVLLESDAAGFGAVPERVIVPEGERFAGFAIRTGDVAKHRVVTVTARSDFVVLLAKVTVRPRPPAAKAPVRADTGPLRADPPARPSFDPE